jgi:hypothetical protein
MKRKEVEEEKYIRKRKQEGRKKEGEQKDEKGNMRDEQKQIYV